MQPCISRVATAGSTAARGSSSSRISGFAYTARARPTRARWPPERFTPRSPISVKSPRAPSCWRSSLRQHADMTLSYHTSS
mmetsp:Transcript_20227/g.32277  ORF Transcript_20227/g.32277 Transcript_20227/m.32277 type:complete len:81 (+) Transcript_20227:1036-1278(+)